MYSKKSKTQNFLTSVTLFLAICITLRQSHAKETQTASDNQLQNRTQQWRSPQTEFQDTNLKLTARSAIAGVFCFIAASISSAGGIGGGGLYIPILTISAGLELRTATSFSAFMVTGGSIANVMCNMLGTIGGKSFIDYDIALLSEPCMLLGVSIGVICNLVFPEWLVTVLFAIFLAWSTFKTCTNGFSFWKLESENLKRDHTCGKIENGIVKDENCDGSEGVKSYEEPLLSVDESNQLSFPWMKLGVLVLVWFCFSVLYLFRGNRDGQGIGDLTRRGTSNKLIFPLMALLAGILGGLFGIGGGMLISPLLLQIGTAPEVTAATCSFMVFFSSTMSAFQYLLLGMEQSGTALIFAIVCFVASLLGLLVVQKAIQEFGRASLIVFSVSIVMALSTVLITSFEALDIWRDYTSGNYMGFKLPC
ncbi:sulfite exporter TauE/SafE family protein 2 isoform X2 [Citrus sinensis]|uniref:sulfite exporter TauE/SafE family protein 2 isoform X2 n=1 Tax=Citrus sinensis TaxID=2711 RepID=UPI0022775A03|nr:sulfite exporter TauE/SafE family protein 2 isoform X2 [Citrus sinensis]